MEDGDLNINWQEGHATVAVSPQTLSDSRDLALVALQRTRMPIVVTDPRLPDNPIVLANAAFLELTGYTASEVVGRNCRLLQGPDTDRNTVARMRAAIDDEVEVEEELLNYRKDGSSFWNTVLVSPVHSESGELLYFFASQKDETARRRAVELELNERKLLKEIDHRAKNALALVQSIVRLTKRDDFQAFASSIEGRVDAIARAHRLLADANWSDIPLARLFEGAGGAFLPDRIGLSGADTMVRAAHVQPLSLLIHEMIDNAVKHGALSQEVGRIDVHWENDNVRKQITIRFDESGGPSPTPRATAGLGQRLIQRITSQQLGGAASFSYDSGGLRSTLTMAA